MIEVGLLLCGIGEFIMGITTYLFHVCVPVPDLKAKTAQIQIFTSQQVFIQDYYVSTRLYVHTLSANYGFSWLGRHVRSS